MTLRGVLVVTLLPGGFGGWLPTNPSILVSVSRSPHWPDDAPRGAVSTFCVEHGISRKSFYELRKRARADGPAAVLEPGAAAEVDPDEADRRGQGAGDRGACRLEASGLDHGPISVHDKMGAMGLPVVPSTASLARIFREAGVAGVEPRKKPGRRGAGSCTRHRTRAGNWTRPSTS